MSLSARPTSRQERFEPRQDAILTRMESQVHDADRVSLFLDEEFAFGIHIDLVLSFGLKKGRMLTVGEQRALLEADQPLRARQKALRFLASKPRTEHEIRERLEQEGIAPNVQDDVLLWLRERGFVNDEAYAKAYVESRMQAGTLGSRRVANELRQKGIDRGVIEEALREDKRSRIDDSAVTSLAQRKWDQLHRETDARKRSKKVFDFLVRRGFSFDEAREAVREIDRNGQDAEDEG